MNTFIKKTKIVATIGPNTENKKSLIDLMNSGMNVCRTNMSHDTMENHRERIRLIKSVAKELNKNTAVLMDLSGPKIRIGDFIDPEGVEIFAGEKLILTGDKSFEKKGTKNKMYFNYPHIEKDIKKDMIIMMHDGKKKLIVEKVLGKDIYTKVLVGGFFKTGKKGINLPGAYLSIPALTEKDKKDMVFGVQEKVDFFALSFVRTAKDVEDLRKLILKNKGYQKIISKIETVEAIENIDEIIKVSDGIMIARGDLAVEVGPENVPVMQKNIIKKCNSVGKPVIVATQMLESMINSPVPTRAEVSDVANAIFDGADAVMLSEETTLGKYPKESVQMMTEIAKKVEKEIGTHKRFLPIKNNIQDSISNSIIHNAEDINAKLIVCLTESGYTPRIISRYKPNQPIIALTKNEIVARQNQLIYGCYSFIIKPYTGVHEFLKDIDHKLIKDLDIAKKGDVVVVAAGIPFGVSGATNMMIIQTLK